MRCRRRGGRTAVPSAQALGRERAMLVSGGKTSVAIRRHVWAPRACQAQGARRGAYRALCSRDGIYVSQGGMCGGVPRGRQALGRGRAMLVSGGKGLGASCPTGTRMGTKITQF